MLYFKINTFDTDNDSHINKVLWVDFASFGRCATVVSHKPVNLISSKAKSLQYYENLLTQVEENSLW